MVFSNSSTKQGIVEQVYAMTGLDSAQYPIARIVASVNNYLDTCTGYLIGSDRRFQWDDTNHTKAPEGYSDIVANSSDYSFLTDEQGNRILTLTRVDILRPDGTYEQLQLIDQEDIEGAVGQYQATTGIPQHYDKIADNIIRLYPNPATSVTAGLRWFFQRAPSYFTASDTTKEPGVSPLLHRGFVIHASYDAALAKGRPNLSALSVEREVEKEKMLSHFNSRNKDASNRSFSAEYINAI